MRALALIAVLVVAILLVVAAAYYARRLRQQWLARRGKWTVRERAAFGGHGVWLVSPAGEWSLYGQPIPSGLDEPAFQDALLERRVGAQERVDVLNRRLP